MTQFCDFLGDERKMFPTFGNDTKMNLKLHFGKIRNYSLFKSIKSYPIFKGGASGERNLFI